jgi:hypothetical protein
MSAANKGKRPSDKCIQASIRAHQGKVSPLKGIAGKPHTEEWKNSMRAIMKGRVRSAEHCAAISASKMGHTVSEEARAKLSEAMKGRPSPMKGKHLSEAAIAKMSAAKKDKPWSPARRAAEERKTL